MRLSNISTGWWHFLFIWNLWQKKSFSNFNKLECRFQNLSYRLISESARVETKTNNKIAHALFLSTYISKLFHSEKCLIQARFYQTLFINLKLCFSYNVYIWNFVENPTKPNYIKKKYDILSEWWDYWMVKSLLT